MQDYELESKFDDLETQLYDMNATLEAHTWGKRHYWGVIAAVVIGAQWLGLIDFNQWFDDFSVKQMILMATITILIFG